MSDRPAPESPILVTGANGFIGSALTRCLVEAGCEVRGLILRGTDPGPLEALRVPVFQGDICQPDTLAAPLAGVRTVFHLAALASDWAPFDLFLRIIADGTQNVLDAARQAGVGRFVHMSSLAVHRFSGHVEADELTPTGNDVNGYCTAKVIAESMVRRAEAQGWFATTIIRPGAVIFGPGDTTAFVHLAPALLKGQVPLVGGGRALTCYSHIDNLTAGMCLAAAAPEAAGEVFILTDDRRISWREYLTAVCQALGAPARFRSVPAWLAEAGGWSLEAIWKLARRAKAPPIHLYRVGLVARDFHFSCAKAKRMLGYRPQVGLEEGLIGTVAWYRNWQTSRAEG